MKKFTAIALATGLALSGAGLFTTAAYAHDGAWGMGHGEGNSYGVKPHGKKGGGMGGGGMGGGAMGGGAMGGGGMGGGAMSGGGMGGMMGGMMGRMMGGMGPRGAGEKGDKMGMGLFKRLDADGDGVVTREEAQKFKPKGSGMVARLDTDKDGVVTSAEIDAMLAKKRESLLEHYDVNNDGKIDKSDRSALIEQRFTRFDADKDGKITREEVRKVMGEWRERRREGLRQMRREFWGRGAE